MKRPKRLDFSPEQVESLITRIETQQLEISDYPLLADLIRAIIWMDHSLNEKTLTIKRLQSIFGVKTESANNLIKFMEKQNNNLNAFDQNTIDTTASNLFSDEKNQLLEVASTGEAGLLNQNSINEKPNLANLNKNKSKGHGHRPSSDYKSAIIINIAHETLKKGDLCPDCDKGYLFNLSPGTVLRITGQPWLNVDIYRPEKLRCSLCQKIFTAKLAKELYTESRVDKSAKAIVSIMKYRGGVPFYRQEQLQTIFENPISDTEIWSMTRDVSNDLEPVYVELCNLASQADLFHNDDTTAKILDFMKENKELDPERKGVFTTALLAVKDNREIALFFTGRKHAGENLNDILDMRDEELPVPIQSCDAASKNEPKDHDTNPGYCNAHTRRKFYEIASIWPKECLQIVAGFDIIFLNDKRAKQNNLSAEERLKWHQEKSAPIMEKIKNYCANLIETRQIEPNSSFGKAYNYLKNHWDGFTLFLRIPGVPISNNADERLIKRSVLNRKNAYFFKNKTGAKIADILMSFIETCVLNKINPYNYFVEIQKHREKVDKSPESWFPWNYEETLKNL